MSFVYIHRSTSNLHAREFSFEASTPKISLRLYFACTFVQNPPSMALGGKGTAVPGCVPCEKILYTTDQYLSHLALDVLPVILEFLA
jgi:hypothetical protein